MGWGEGSHDTVENVVREGLGCFCGVQEEQEMKCKKMAKGYFGKTLWTAYQLICILKNRWSFLKEEHGGKVNG